MAQVDQALAALVQAVLTSPKYRHMDPALVEALAAAELAKGRRGKDAVKATKNKLHQVAGAYFPDKPPYAGWLAQLDAAPDDAARRTLARTVMAQHASTRERLTFLDSFYATILAGLPPIHTLLDLACGLNPLAAAWMPLEKGARYLACDIYQDQVEFLSGWLGRVGQAGEAFVCNLLAETPLPAADVVLLLKTIPCLEQADKEIGARLLARIDAPILLISYPARSLGGRAKGMVDTYAGHFAELVAGTPWQVTRFDFPTEVVFRVER
jgi:16S rRNA (guanine(1405)-N(7))-methyltransferase